MLLVFLNNIGYKIIDFRSFSKKNLDSYILELSTIEFQIVLLYCLLNMPP